MKVAHEVNTTQSTFGNKNKEENVGYFEVFLEALKGADLMKGR